MYNSEPEKPPVNVGDKMKLGVVRFGKNGDPIMMHKGFVIFLKGIPTGGVPLNSMFEIKITKVLPKYAFAEKTNND